MQQAQIAVDYVSPNGGFVPLDPRSMKYTDAATMAVYEDSDFINRALKNTLKPSQVDPDDYTAIYYTGGHGVMWDFPDNPELQAIALAIYQHGGYVTSVCHGIAGLLNIKDQTAHDRHKSDQCREIHYVDKNAGPQHYLPEQVDNSVDRPPLSDGGPGLLIADQCHDDDSSGEHIANTVRPTPHSSHVWPDQMCKHPQLHHQPSLPATYFATAVPAAKLLASIAVNNLQASNHDMLIARSHNITVEFFQNHCLLQRGRSDRLVPSA